MIYPTRFHERGVTTVEVAIIGLLMMIVLFALIEFGRLLWTWGTLSEATRRGARAAIVCPVDTDAARNIAVFGNPNGNGNAILTGLTVAHIDLGYVYRYFDEEDDQWKYKYSSDTDELKDNFANIRFARVSITDYEIDLAIPILNPSLTAPPFETTLPVENMGLIPGKVERQCS